MSDKQRPLTAEDLAEIKDFMRDKKTLEMNSFDWLRSLLAEVQRLREIDEREGLIAITLRDEKNGLTAEVQRQQGEIERLTNARITEESRWRAMFKDEADSHDRLQAENDQLRQQLDEWKRLLLQAEAKQKGDRTDG